MELNKITNYIEKLLIENDVEPKKEIFEKFRIYYDILIESNKKFNLTAITEKDEVYIKHFADSLLGIKNFALGSSVCDMGTGAGFPGIVLKIARPDLNITLVDSLNKRVMFLNEVISQLQLANIRAIHYRAEDIEFKNSYLNSFDYVVARAVASLNTLTEYCLPYVKVGGKFIAYKSQNVNDEIFQAKNCVVKLGGIVKCVQNYNLVNVFDRNLVVIEKIKTTSNIYPRDKNKPKTHPL